jgi:site-specific DNA recombinase
MRAVIYARYSSDLQSDASIEDQIRLCEERLRKEGWPLVATYTDRALSGASALRPGYQKLLEDARKGEFDVVMAEALDRLSRDQEDVAGLFKRLKFSGVSLVTLAEGEISELHVGLKGTMNAVFLKDLAAKTHRGLRGRIEAGRSAGGISYGYKVVRKTDERGDPVHGERAIDRNEAAVVHRIFREFTTGKSPRAIARQLNAERIPGPGGRPWGDTTIRGHHRRRTGILRNELYVGRLVWNRLRYVKDPNTGKRLSRINPESEWIMEEVPDLRILTDAEWQQVQERLGTIRSTPMARKIQESRFWEKRRARHLLTGLVQCGCCGGTMAAVGKDYLACGGARRQGTCTNRTGVRRRSLEGLVLDALKRNLMQPALVKEFADAFVAEINAARRQQDNLKKQREKELAEVNRKLDGLIEAIATGLRSPGLQAKLDDLERRKAMLAADDGFPAASSVRLHPNLSGLYRQKVAALQQSFEDPSTRDEAIGLLRGLIESVRLTPKGEGLEIELMGDIARMVELPANASCSNLERDLMRSSVKVVAGRGFEPLTFRL